MKLPFDCYAVYEFQRSQGHWALVQIIRATHVNAEGLRDVAKTVLEMTGARTTSYYYSKDCDIPEVI